ncbi:MAG: sensor histidine kinase [Acetivibrionales bacterium]|jgi:two-component system sensor histidine kinase DegS|nr:sensor histidine kinase [Bacillota bacterium]HOA55524.1 sensor histidine kinase [Clostridiales bacterium]HQD32004.1 sensor histidine kinase [Clostridiales bacterium]
MSRKINVAQLDKIIKRTIRVINESKSEIYEIAESSRRECKRLEDELEELKEQVKQLISEIEVLEVALKDSKRRLMLINKNFSLHTQEELKEAYEKADNLRVELAVKREMERFLIKRRNELEIRIKDTLKTVQRADKLITQVGAALGYLTGDLQEISLQLEGLQHKQLLGLKIIKAQEEERQRVARDIHDGPAQMLSNVVLKAEICERLIDVDLDQARNELQNLKKIVRDSLQDVRKIIYNLRPMSLDDLGLIPTLQRYILTFQEESGISVSFITKGSEPELKSVISLTVFRIVQEALSNVAKHARANNAVMQLEFLEKNLKLYVYDDGIGFDTAKLNDRNEDITSGFGLVSMRERVELLGGDMRISSEPGKGTRLNIIIPFTQEEEVNDGEQN